MASPSSCVSADAVRRPTQRGSRRLGQGPAFSLPASPQITALTPSAPSSRNTLQQAKQLPARPALSAAAAAPRPPLGCLPCSCSVAGAGSVRLCADVLCTGMRYGVPIKHGVCASSYALVLCCRLLQQHAVWCAPHTWCSVLPSALQVAPSRRCAAARGASSVPALGGLLHHVRGSAAGSARAARMPRRARPAAGVGRVGHPRLCCRPCRGQRRHRVGGLAR